MEFISTDETTPSDPLAQQQKMMAWTLFWSVFSCRHHTENQVCQTTAVNSGGSSQVEGDVRKIVKEGILPICGIIASKAERIVVDTVAYNPDECVQAVSSESILAVFSMTKTSRYFLNKSKGCSSRKSVNILKKFEQS